MHEQEEIYRDPDELNPSSLIGSVAGGIVGAAIGGLIWAAIAYYGGIEIGLVALVVGFLAGTGTRMGAMGAMGLPFQIIAAITALIGYVGAKCGIVVLILNSQAPGLLKLDFGSFNLIQSAMVETLGFFDLIWVALVAYSAWSIPGYDND